MKELNLDSKRSQLADLNQQNRYARPGAANSSGLDGLVEDANAEDEEDDDEYGDGLE